MKSIHYLLLLFIAIIAFPAHAYELATHGHLTYEAYKRSVLKPNSELLNDLGIKETPTFGSSYYDISGNQVEEREKSDFEQSAKRMPDEVDPLSLSGWLLRGAIREDDLGYAAGFKIGGDPHDDPYGPFWRVMNHFYDPVGDGRPLTLSAIQRGLFTAATGESAIFHTAPDWGTGSQDSFTQPNSPETGRRNHFTLFDAREAMYRALTGKKADGTEISIPSNSSAKDERTKYWATTFRALGDVVHLIQDMAQPQHTRNDYHAGVIFFGHKSIYEHYIECRFTGLVNRVVSNAGSIWCDDFSNLEDYPIPVFSKYSDFFSTREGTNGRGMADYSNRGFFSAGTNLGKNSYAFPSNNSANYSKTEIAVDSSGAKLHLLTGAVSDTKILINQSASLTTEGMWYRPLRDFSSPANAETYGYTLTRQNYDDMANLLIPRAVAYSAGLIDYFFRGRIEAEDAHFTDSGISLKLRNAIDPELIPEWSGEQLYAKTSAGDPSTLTVTYQYKDEQDVTRYVTSDPVPLVSDPNNSANDDNVAPGEVSRHVYSFTINVPFVNPSDPRIFKDLKYRLVFRGRLGNEDDAVVAAAFRPVSGFLVSPSYPPADALPTDSNPEPRMIFKTSSGWKLAPDRGLRAGNIDWKGRYETDPSDPSAGSKATKVLSWVGSKMRYFPDNETCISAPFSRCKWVSSSFFTNEIFENGEVIATAPSRVLGASIARDGNGKDWLVAICAFGTEDVVYKRPYRNGSDAMHDPVTAPNGWDEIGRFDASSLNQGPSRETQAADIPWFFSPDGKKAQTIRRWWETTSTDFINKLLRLEINLTNDIEMLPPQNHDNFEGFTERHTCTTNYDQYGAGSGQSTYTASGEYVIAVDYDKAGNEVLAKIRITGNGTKTTNVSVAHDHDPNQHHNDVKTGSTINNSTYREDLVWKDNETFSIHSDVQVHNTSWGSGPQPSNNFYTRTINRNSSEKEISYLVDLRNRLYSYYYVTIQDSDSVSGGVTNYRQDISEGNEIRSDLMPSTISYFSNAYPPYTSNSSPYRLERELNCDPFLPNDFTSRRYGLSNFGWFLQVPGSGMIDHQGLYAISQPSLRDFGYESLPYFNRLSEGQLGDVIITAPPNPLYYPIGVLH